MGYKIPVRTILILAILIDQASMIESGDNEVENTFKLIKEGEKSIKFPNHSKNLILILGNAGSGKSTFTQWIAGDNSKLISKEVARDTGDFIIEDGNRIDSTTTESKTIFPELFIDREHQFSVLYDCPGFNDTRSTSYDIAATYFTKQVVDFAHSLKIIFVVNYSSVRKGVDRQDFMMLLRHVTDFIGNISQFQNSIAMVVTRVDNDYIYKGTVLVSDEKIIAKIADFLQEVKQSLTHQFYLADANEKDKVFYLNAIRFIDVLLQQKEDRYSRIGIFRRPDEPGPLQNIVTLQKGKKHINTILYETLSFTSTLNHQFGYTVSDRSKQDIGALVEEIDDTTRKNIQHIVAKIYTYKNNVSNEIDDAIQSLQTTRDKVFINVAQASLIMILNKRVEKIVSNLTNDVHDFKGFKEIADRYQRTFIYLQITDEFQNISAQGKYFNFLQTVSDRKLQIGPFKSLFEQLNSDLLESKLNILKAANNTLPIISKKINMNLKLIEEEVKAHYFKKINSMEVEVVSTEISYASSLLSNLIDKVKNRKNVTENINEYLSKLGDIKFEARQSVLNISRFENNLHFLSVLGIEKIQKSAMIWFVLRKWIQMFENLNNVLLETNIFYRFLNSLFDRLSQFDIQKNTSFYNVAHLENWGKPGKTQGINITGDNFQLFLTLLKPYNIAEHQSIQNLAITEPYLKALNNLLAFTLKSQLHLECTNSKVINVRGDFIKFSDMFNDNGKLMWRCKTGISNTTNILAMNKVFIDRDFDGSGTEIKLSVIAPKWEIIGNRKITLDGTVGKDHPKAKDSNIQGEQGTDGLAGNPGGAAGQFFGIGAYFKNIASLNISAIGGRGGRGQDGRDGTDGAGGKDAKISDEFQKKSLDTCALGDCVISKYIYYGSPGNKGGDGGNGGQGGYGGPAGKIQMINLSNFRELPNIKVQKGLKGDNGNGGRGGSGGLNGNNANVFCWTTHYKQVCTIDSIFNSGEKGSDGSAGIDGGSSVGLKQPENSIGFQSTSKLLSDYKFNLTASFQNPFRKGTYLKFLSQIDKNFEIKN